MRSFYLLQIGLTLVLAVLGLFDTWQTGFSIAVGSLVMMLNIALLSWTWTIISRKKLIALGLLVIVSKYTILAVVLYGLLSLPWIRPLGFIVGISIFVFTAVAWVLLRNKDKEKECLPA